MLMQQTGYGELGVTWGFLEGHTIFTECWSREQREATSSTWRQEGAWSDAGGRAGGQGERGVSLSSPRFPRGTWTSMQMWTSPSSNRVDLLPLSLNGEPQEGTPPEV